MAQYTVHGYQSYGPQESYMSPPPPPPPQVTPFEPYKHDQSHVSVEYKPHYSPAPYHASAPADSAYHDAPIQEVRRDARARLKHNVCLFISFMAGLAWLGPAVYLLYVNFSSQIIGAGAWCPKGQCEIISYLNPKLTPVLAARADKRNHDLLGALQLASKALEIWFIAIAGSLIFCVSRILARRRGGLPVGYLLTHLEYGDLRYLFRPTIWTSVKRRKQESLNGKLQESPMHNGHLYAFVVLVVILCIISNIMGPAIAVMMIPTLDWVETQRVPSIRLTRTMAASKPVMGFNDTIPNCSAADLAARNFNCSAGTTSRAQDNLDALVESVISVVSQLPADFDPTNANDPGLLGFYAPSLEANMPFLMNTSSAGTASNDETSVRIWAPNRQAIRGLASDFEELVPVVMGNSTAEPYASANNSLALQLQRRAPMLGMDYGILVGNRSVIKIQNDKWISCFDGDLMGVFGEPGWTKCYRWDSGWNETNTYNYITAGAVDEASPVEARLYWTDRMAYIRDDEATACKDQRDKESPEENDFTPTNLDARATCDWDSIFARDMPPQLGFVKGKRDAFVIEWTSRDQSNITTVVTEFHPLTANALYSIDVTEIDPSLDAVTNPFVDAESLQYTVLHADWFLLPTALNPNEEAIPDIPAAQPTGLELTNAMYEIMQYFRLLSNNVTITDADYNSFVIRFLKFSQVSAAIGLQTLSWVTFDGTEVPESMKVDLKDPDKLHPVLFRNIRRRVWKFGLESRTSKLGVTFMILGSLVVVVRTVLLVLSSTSNPSTTEFLISALEHNPRRQYSGATSESEAAKVRYRVEHEPEDERVRYTPV